MESAPIYREVAADLRDRVFSGRWDGKLGSIEEEIPAGALEALVKIKFLEIGTPLSEEQLAAIAREFPAIDVMPTDAHPNEEVIFKREIDYITKILVWAVPELAKN